MQDTDPQLAAIIRNKDMLFRQLGENIDMVFWLRAVDTGELLYISPNYIQICGRTVDWLLENPRAWYETIHPEDRDLVLIADGDRINSNCDVTYRYVHADGTIHWAHDQSSPIRNERGTTSCIAGIMLDVTEKKNREAQIRFLNQIYAALSYTNNALNTCRDETTLFNRVCEIAVDPGGMSMAWIGVCDPATQQIKPVAWFGHNTEYLDGIVISALDSIPEGLGPTGTAFRESRPVFVQDFATADITSPWHERAHHYGWRASAAIGFRRAGLPYAVLTLYHSQPDAFDTRTIDLLIEMATNLGHGMDQLDSEIARKQHEEEIINLGFYDPLTGLPNRRLLMDRLRHAMASSARNHLYGAVLFIDLDHFKVINDTVGHKTGDLLLNEVARRLRALVREEDTIARLGGDEFVVVLEELDQDKHRAMNHAKLVGEKLLQVFAEPYFLDTEEFNCTASIGVVIFYDHDVSMEEILKHSDLAMYGAKKGGRNMLRFFDPAMQHELEKRTRLETDLRRSLPDNQLRMYCQQQVDQHGHVRGGEMLLRWEHPERGLVSPMNFIPLAEETGLIVPIGQWVLREACCRLRQWANSARTSHLTLSVNVSAREFRQGDFVENIAAILADTGANPARLELEITESLLLEGIDEFIAKMLLMKEIGLSFSLDDFGTGYSSLSYLKKLPLNQLKIDRSFVQDLGKDRSDEAIVQTIVRMSETLGLEVIAEGVETNAQRDMLQRYGCNHYQGYLFGRPLPFDQFEQSLLAP